MARDRVDEYLGSLGSDEIATLARQLEELQQSAAWREVQRLLQMEAQRSQNRMALTVLEHAEYAREGGLIYGMQAPDRLILKVRETARAVVLKLSQAERRGGGE